MTKREVIRIPLVKPRFRIGQKVYVPQRNKISETTILNYDAKIIRDDGKLLGVVTGYYLGECVILRKGNDSDMTNLVLEGDFYRNREKAQKASRFLEVRVDNRTWGRAIGDRDVKDDKSPYHVENCDFPPCCANISRARDILLYCQRERGLIVHYRDELERLIWDGHDLKCKKESPLGKILKQLKVSS